MKIWQTLHALVLILILSGCVSWSAVPGVDGYRLNICDKIDPYSLRISGPTNKRMEACVSKHSGASIKRVIISSQGGSVLSALRIGDTMATWKMELIIENECVSSCANYFIPVASRVVLRSGSAIVLHGSIDEGFIEQNKSRMTPEALERTLETAELQRLYAERFDIPQAWLLLRRRYSREEMKVDGLEGEFAPFHPSSRALAFVVVEAPFLLSCFPEVEFEGLENMLTARAKDDVELARALAGKKYARSGSAKCSDYPS